MTALEIVTRMVAQQLGGVARCARGVNQTVHATLSAGRAVQARAISRSSNE